MSKRELVDLGGENNMEDERSYIGKSIQFKCDDLIKSYKNQKDIQSETIDRMASELADSVEKEYLFQLGVSNCRTEEDVFHLCDRTNKPLTDFLRKCTRKDDLYYAIEAYIDLGGE